MKEDQQPRFFEPTDIIVRFRDGSIRIFRGFHHYMARLDTRIYFSYEKGGIVISVGHEQLFFPNDAVASVIFRPIKCGEIT